LIDLAPGFAGIVALSNSTTRGLVDPIERLRMARDGVRIVIRTRLAVFPGDSAVGAPHHPTQLGAGEEHVRILPVWRDPADVRRPGPGREGPGWSAGDVAQRREILPGIASVAAAVEGARLRAGE